MKLEVGLAVFLWAFSQVSRYIAGSIRQTRSFEQSSLTARNAVLLRYVRLDNILGKRHVDALLDTGATFCAVSTSVAFSLGFNEGNRLSKQMVHVVGGRMEIDSHKLEYVRASTVSICRVSFCVGDLDPASRFMLFGLSFVDHITTTLDLD